MNSKIIIRVARPTANNKVSQVGKRFATFNGTIVYVSNDLNVDRVGVVPTQNIVRKRGTVCVADFDVAADILEYIEETFQEDKTLSVVYMIIEVDESIDVLYSDPSNPNTWTEGFNFHNVESVIVEDEMPEEVRNSHPLLRRNPSNAAHSSQMNAPTTNTPNTPINQVQPSRNLVREVRKRRLAQEKAARESLENAINKSTTPDTPVVSSECEITDEEREVLMLEGGFSNKYISTLSREKADKLLAVLAPKVTA